MILGTYETYLNAVSSANFLVLIPMGIGLVIGAILFLILTQYLLQKHFSPTYYTIIGFVLGSLLILYPGFEFNFTGLTSIAIFILCYFIGKSFESKSDN